MVHLGAQAVESLWGMTVAVGEGGVKGTAATAGEARGRVAG